MNRISIYIKFFTCYAQVAIADDLFNLPKQDLTNIIVMKIKPKEKRLEFDRIIICIILIEMRYYLDMSK